MGPPRNIRHALRMSCQVKNIQIIWIYVHQAGLRCLFTYGYTTNVIAHQGVLDEDLYFLQKPFSIQDLASRVRESLERK